MPSDDDKKETSSKEAKKDQTIEQLKAQRPDEDVLTGYTERSIVGGKNKAEDDGVSSDDENDEPATGRQESAEAPAPEEA